MENQLTQLKNRVRRQAYDARNSQPDKDWLSRLVMERVLQLPSYRQARTAMWYIDCRSELRTRHHLRQALASDQRIVVPYCMEDHHGQSQLGLWWLEDFDELVVGSWKILEPPRNRWQEAGKRVAPEELDVVLVPGVAFDRHGARMGSGQGHYDRLLPRLRPDCVFIAPCYQSQVFDQLPVGPHDVFMDFIVTEHDILPGPPRQPSTKRP